VDACWDDACAEAARLVAGLDVAAFRQAIDARARWFWADPGRHRTGRLDLRAASRGIAGHALEQLGRPDPAVAAQIGNLYRDLREERACLFPGAIETIERLRAGGVRLGMMTNGGSASQRAKIERFGLARHFDCIVIEGEFGAGKPDRRVFETLLAGCQASPAETWAVGDNLEWDVAGPQSLGITGIWVDSAGKGLPPGNGVTPDRVIRSLAELI
jgi:putative hydrolase of the HAD superfamily